MRHPALLVAALALFFFSLSTTVSGLKAYCGSVCLDAANGFVYEPCPEDVGYYTCLCQNPVYLGNYALCIQDQCDDNDSSWDDGTRNCLVYGEGTRIPGYRKVLANATLFVQDVPANITETIYAPVRISNEMWDPIYRTATTFLFNMRDSTLFGWAISAFSGVACLFAGLRYLYLCNWSHTSLSQEHEGRVAARSSPIAVYSKKWFLMPALIGKANSARPSVFGLSLSVPTRLQTILVVCYVGLNVIAVCVRYHLFLDNTYWPGDKVAQLTRYIADRSGVLAFSNMPLLIAFAGRNNILIWVTGSSFATFNVFHKWIGRVCVAHAFVHTVCYTLIYWRRGGAATLNAVYKEPYLQYGAVAMTAGSILLFQGMHNFRQWAYETFLVLHIALAIAFIVGCWYHVHLIPYDNYMPWLYASIAIWAFDRAIRLFRIIVYNIRWSGADGWRCTNARITRVDGQGLVRMDVTMPNEGWKFRPGQYVYLYMAGSLRDRPWESHPFTIYSYHVPKTASPSISSSDKEKQGLGLESPPSTSHPSLHTTQNREITLYVRPYGGMTKRLDDLVQPGNVVQHTVLVEGPYGHGLPLHHYDNVTLMAGGVGITAILPYFRQLAAASSPSAQRVHMVWIIHELACLKDIHRDILNLCSPSRTVSIYVTAQSKAADEAESRVMDELLDDDDSPSSNISIALGTDRPVCLDLISGTTSEEVGGSLAVVVCGPGGMIDDCRAACVEMLSTNRATVEFFSEEFGW